MGELRITFLIIIFFGCNSSNLDYPQIYFEHGEYKLYEILSENLNKNVIKDYNEYQLILFTDIKSPLKNKYIFLSYKNEIKIIKAPFHIACKDDNLNWETAFHCIIDKDNFNNYLKIFNISKQDFIKSNFINFLYDYKKYKAITRKIDVTRILDSIPRKNQEDGFDHEFIINNEKKLDAILATTSESENIYWFPNFGLFKFKFDFANSELLNVESSFLGYLGNEYKPW